MSKKKKIKNQWLFIDESGKPEIYSTKNENLVKNNKASKFLILASIRTPDQLDLQQKVTAFKLSLLKDKNLTKIFSAAYSLDTFHAHSDYPQVRNKFYNFITQLDIKIDVLVVEKLLAYDSLQRNPGQLYGVMTGQLIKNICHQTQNTEVIFSRKDSKLKLRRKLEIEVERVRLGYLNNHPNLNPSIQLSYHHNPHYTHGGLQIADYIAYAIFQVYERNNWEWYEIIKNKVGKIQDICNKKYFTKSNPLQLSI